MKVVVCFGDSNTWGSNPVDGTRFPPDKRWTGVAQLELGAGYRIIEEGLSGRTTNLDDIIEEERNGRQYLPACLLSHRPIDLVTIMLGTNDLKERFHRSASDIAQSAAALGKLAKRSGCGIDDAPPRVLLMAPPPVAQLSELDEMFRGAEQKSRDFSKHYRYFAEQDGLDFLDAGAVIRSSDVDGIHFDASEHQKLGLAVAAEIRRLIG
jgi:lysophospholipase L1-like esterase